MTAVVTFLSAVITALCAGSIALFALYGPVFQARLQYTQLQVNGVAIASSVALYLPVSALGYLCDKHGPRPLSVLAFGLFGCGYGLASWSVTKPNLLPYPFMLFAFFLIGVGTCAMYLSAVATCAKNFAHGRHRGLALSSPIAAFGLSGTCLSFVATQFFMDKESGLLDIAAFFRFLAILLMSVALMGLFTLRFMPTPEEATPLLAKPSATRFVSDSTMWAFALGFLVVIGPGEAFVNNLGSVIVSLNLTTAPTHVAILSTTSTAARLATGTLSDYFAPGNARGGCSISRVTFLLGSALMLSLGLLGAAFVPTTALPLMTALIGAGYGAVFSLTPLIISVVWGTQNFATHWGIVAMLPAAGSAFWSLVYSVVYESGSEDGVFCYGRGCFAATFEAMACSIWIAGGLIVLAWMGWSRRGVVV